MALKTDKPEIEQLMEKELGGHVEQVDYNEEENCVEVVVNTGADRLEDKVKHLSDAGYSIQVERDRFKVF